MRRKKVLIIRLSSLGDVVLATVAPQILQDRFELFFLTKKEFSQILEDTPHLNLITLKSSSISDIIKTALLIRKMNIDYILDLQDKISTFIIRKILDPSGRKTIVWDSQRIERRLTIISGDFSRIKHTVERFSEAAFNVLKRENLSSQLSSKREDKAGGRFFHNYSSPVVPKIFPPPEPEMSEIRNISNYVVIAPEASKKTRMWNLQECNKLVESLERKGIKTVLVGKDPTLERFFFGGIKLFGKTSIRDLKYLISKASCVVALDSAVSHMASALNVPVVAVFTSSSPYMGFYPINSKVVMRENVRCRPCSIYGKNVCISSHWLCTYVPYQKVENEVLKFIQYPQTFTR